ncbi:unnamed protein product [Heligmosomoides polygyrus]|uniref:G protein-coupled receptor n=1 Tax=Heligmosomoides polygyrus TaxID=6339 RepID=A0A3P7YDZ3_HELPZ|nr:unnamed protein product [Heligmosomoides polygyrus]
MDSEKMASIKTNMLIYSAEGLIILLVNIPLVLIIILLPQFRVHKEFLFIAGLAVGDLIYTVGHMMSSIRRIFVIDSSFGGDMVTTTKAGCVMDVASIAFFYGNGVVGEMTLISSVDRLLATAFPIWHFQQRIRYSVIMCLRIMSGFCPSQGTPYADSTEDMAGRSSSPVSSLCFEVTFSGLRAIVTAHRCGCVFLSVLIYIAVSFLLYKIMINFILFVGRHREFQRVFCDLLHSRRKVTILQNNS